MRRELWGTAASLALFFAWGCGSSNDATAQGQGGNAGGGGQEGDAGLEGSTDTDASTGAGGNQPWPDAGLEGSTDTDASTSDGGAAVCDCSLAALGCGSSLAAAAKTAGCSIPLLPEHDGDLLACSDGTWSVQAACDKGCEVGSGAPDACAGLPTISMDLLVIQAQVEPFRGDQPSLPGDFDVEQVQQALVDEKIDVIVDGWFGNDTADAYATWQKSLGYSGLDATGIPGPSSLAALGTGRFEIAHKIIVGPKVSYSGKTVNQRTKDMLTEADSLLAHGIALTQGSYNPGGVDASAGTHDGGGTVDISVSSLSTTQRWLTVQALRRVGFAAWLRTPSQGFSYHIHAVAIGDTDVSLSARNQIADYYVGKNALASHAADNTPDAYRVPFTWWEKYQGR